jgi:hypothetical protein
MKGIFAPQIYPNSPNRDLQRIKYKFFELREGTLEKLVFCNMAKAEGTSLPPD